MNNIIYPCSIWSICKQWTFLRQEEIGYEKRTTNGTWQGCHQLSWRIKWSKSNDRVSRWGRKLYSKFLSQVNLSYNMVIELNIHLSAQEKHTKIQKIYISYIFQLFIPSYKLQLEGKLLEKHLINILMVVQHVPSNINDILYLVGMCFGKIKLNEISTYLATLCGIS
jgi:hypothetical protein